MLKTAIFHSESVDFSHEKEIISKNLWNISISELSLNLTVPEVTPSDNELVTDFTDSPPSLSFAFLSFELPVQSLKLPPACLQRTDQPLVTETAFEFSSAFCWASALSEITESVAFNLSSLSNVAGLPVCAGWMLFWSLRRHGMRRGCKHFQMSPN